MPSDKLQASCHVPSDEWLPSGHSTIKARLVECCRDGCPSGRFSHLHRWTLELCQSDHRVLGHLPDQGPFPRLLSLAGQPALGRASVVPNFFHLRMMEATVFLGTFNAAEMFGTVPHICALSQLRLGALRTILLWHALSTVGPYIDRCLPFQIMSNQLCLSQVDSNQVVETFQGWSMETGCSTLSLRAKGLNTYVNKLFLFFIV